MVGTSNCSRSLKWPLISGKDPDQWDDEKKPDPLEIPWEWGYK
jgi:hypothetical protein